MKKKSTKKLKSKQPSMPTHPLDPVLAIVKVVTEFVEREAITLEGIYRISGVVKEVETISKALVKYTHTNVLPNFSKYDPYGVAQCLKRLLSNLKEPIVPYATYDKIISLVSTKPEDYVEQLQSILETLPPQNLLILRHIIRHLRIVLKHEPENKMSAKNLSIVFGPCTLRSPLASSNPFLTLKDASTVTSFIHICITEYEQLFESSSTQGQQSSCWYDFLDVYSKPRHPPATSSRKSNEVKEQKATRHLSQLHALIFNTDSTFDYPSTPRYSLPGLVKSTSFLSTNSVETSGSITPSMAEDENLEKKEIDELIRSASSFQLESIIEEEQKTLNKRSSILGIKDVRLRHLSSELFDTVFQSPRMVNG